MSIQSALGDSELLLARAFEHSWLRSATRSLFHEARLRFLNHNYRLWGSEISLTTPTVPATPASGLFLPLVERTEPPKAFRGGGVVEALQRMVLRLSRMAFGSSRRSGSG